VLTRDQLERRIPADIRSNLGSLELKARVDLAEDVLTEADNAPPGKAKKFRQFADDVLGTLSFRAYLAIAKGLNVAIDQTDSPEAKEEFRSQLLELTAVQPVMLLAARGESITGIIREMSGQSVRRPWWRRLFVENRKES
jgi:hypothetical protein